MTSEGGDVGGNQVPSEEPCAEISAWKGDPTEVPALPPLEVTVKRQEVYMGEGSRQIQNMLQP